MNITKQVTLILAICLTLAAVVTLVPAYLIVRAELMSQLDQRLHDALRHTQSLLELEQRQVENTVTLAADRPTLARLLRERSRDALHAYLEAFQANTRLTVFYVSDSQGEWLAGTPASDTGAMLAFRAPVQDVGFVSGGVLIDAAFLTRLQAQTTFTYALDTDASTPDRQHFIRRDGLIYHAASLRLPPAPADAAQRLTVMLPVTGLLTAEPQIIALLIASTLMVAALASLGGGFYVRGRIRPLWKVTAAAREMGRGNLAKPIVNPAKSPEIHTLAEVLERTRGQLQHTLQELSESKAWSDALIQSVIEGIITLDAHGAIVFFSEGAARITHITPQDAIGQPIDRVLRLVEGESLTDFIPPVGGRRSIAVQAEQGEALTLAITRARQSEAGQTTIVLHDITEETERHNLQAYFLAHVSHEFRTPLAGMKVSIELLLENARHLSASELDELLNSLYLSVSSLQNLIDNLLESSKIEASHFSLRRQTVHFNQILSDALRLVQPFLTRRQQTLTLEQPFALPPLSADATRLTQVLMNLLSNASKYSPMHSPINLYIETRGDRLYFAVADRGRGVPNEQRESIFRQFVRLSGDSSSEYSSGLGLAVVKAIIEAHGGQVGVEARDGGGSLFWFTLPIKETMPA